MLSTEQEYAFEQFKQGKNIFITGPGGSGKSELIRRMATYPFTQVCAMTGCAAVLLECNAKTVHSWAGIGIGDKPIDEIIQSMKKRNKDMWKETQCLIVDEVSMMSDTLFELLDSISKRLRRSIQPFGGMQVVFVGDFYQLPPIENTFCFESPLWSMFEEIKLTKIFRQKDEIYQKILNQIRIGRITRSSLDILTTRVQVPSIPCTKLFPIRQQVDHINQTEYAKLTGKEYTYTAIGKSSRCEPCIKLKEGCRVMHTINHEHLCNGSLGVVIGFEVYPIVQFVHGIEIIRPYTWKYDDVTQLPLVHAWAMTIHKAQGCSLDCAEIDAGSGIFECGQTYVALSRVRNLEGLYLTSLDITKIKIHPKLKKN
jgi:ATP-dependent DNA helicase PIF1